MYLLTSIKKIGNMTTKQQIKSLKDEIKHETKGVRYCLTQKLYFVALEKMERITDYERQINKLIEKI